MHKPLPLCCHDLFSHPKTPTERECCIWRLASCIPTFQLQHIAGALLCFPMEEIQNELCNSAVSSITLTSGFPHWNCHGCTTCSRALCGEAGGRPRRDVFLLWLSCSAMHSPALTEPRYPEAWGGDAGRPHVLAESFTECKTAQPARRKQRTWCEFSRSAESIWHRLDGQVHQRNAHTHTHRKAGDGELRGVLLFF